MSHDARIAWLALMAGAPGAVIAITLIWTGDFSPKVEWTVTALVLSVWLGFTLYVREEVIRPLHTISNVLAALREGDFSVRGRLSTGDDALGAAVVEMNELGLTLQAQRLGAVEATALLQRVMEEIDVAIFAFDELKTLRLVNQAGERLLGQPGARMLGLTAEQLAMTDLLTHGSARTIDTSFPGGSGPWEVRRSTFRQGGRPHELIVLADLRRALREEERQAWQRLVRVLGHEINNSLAPIRSIAGSLQDVLKRRPRPDGWEDDVARGLAVIGRRSDALNRFMTSYARLARLPPPELRSVDVGDWIARVVELEKRVPVKLTVGPAMQVQADRDQLEQLLINLVQNAVDAVLENQGSSEVTVTWRKMGSVLEVLIEDDGPGIANSSNLFVPFFTTKPNGSGIGLVLSRQIAEAHRGQLTLQNRSNAGCVARLTLPVL